MADDKIKKYTLKMQNLINQLGRAEEFVKSQIDTASLEELELRLTAIEKTCNTCESIQTTLEGLDDDQDFSKSRIYFEETYFKLVAALMVKINEHKIKNKGVIPIVNQEFVNPIKLPNISLPTFAGEYSQWRTFYDTFTAVVHTNTGLDDITKFHYLRSSMTGAAFRRIQSLDVTKENYVTAIKLLRDRYDNNKLIAQEHIKGLFNLPALERGSSAKIREIIDLVNNHLEALKNLGHPTAQWDPIIVYMVMLKLDQFTRSKWEETSPANRLATLNELLNFLERRSQSLEGVSNIKTTTAQSIAVNRPIKPQGFSPKSKTFSVQSTSNSNQPASNSNQSASNSYQKGDCIFCLKPYHYITKCRMFKTLTLADRYKEINRLNACINCLKINHHVNTCLSGPCRECYQKHHSLLHGYDSNQFTSNSNAKPFPQKSTCTENPLTSEVTNTQSQLTSLSSINNNLNFEILLATALVKVSDKFGQPIICRAILDSGSQLHFVSERLLHQLGLKPTKTNVPINGIGNAEIHVKEKIFLNISSCATAFTTQLEAHVLPKITDYLPSKYINVSNWALPSNIELADPKFNVPQRIDLLIGAELYGDLLSCGQIKISENLPILQNTVLGWVVTGKTSIVSNVLRCHVALDNATVSLDEQVTKFWEVEHHERPVKRITSEEAACEEHFSKTVTRDKYGRYIVRLPFKINAKQIGSSFQMALRRFHHLEKKLNRDSNLKLAYTTFINEYKNLNHMERLAPDELPQLHYFLPHHCVIKPESSSTKLRVVFDASAKSSTQLSLNDCLMVGPTIQADLFSILTKFRMHRYVFTADISKMYRQITVHEDDRKFQLILWRENLEVKPTIYRLSTVTYGTSAAPFLAMRCLNQLSMDDGHAFPLASSVLMNDFYVDDVMTGADTIPKTLRLQNELITLLGQGGFELRKFCANHPELLKAIPENYHETHLKINDDEVIKTLGLIWQPTLDNFQFNIPGQEGQLLTKRLILSDLAQIFDPLGLLGPVVVLGKIFLQQLWKLKIDWDDSLPEEYQHRWSNYRNQLVHLNNFRIPRQLFIPEYDRTDVQLHAFSDSSELAYGACCYLRTTDSNKTVSVQLICAKSRIAPTKSLSLPRLELCAALLMTELVQRLKVLIPTTSVDYWTDSTIVLSWISAPSYNWSTFVATRVSKIQQNSKIDQWHHISTKENPADLISRGMFPTQLCTSKFWIHGPTFLESNIVSTEVAFKILEDVPDRKTQRVVLTATDTTGDFLDSIRHSNKLMKLQNIIAYCLRFLKGKKSSSRNSGPLQIKELKESMNTIMRIVQRDSFATELTALNKREQVPMRSRLRSLNPFLDDEGLIRVGGRLQNAVIPFKSKHQVVLPKNNFFTYMLLNYLHTKHMHASPQTLLAITRQNYWPLDGKNMARRIVHRCIKCFRVKPKTIEHMMGNLPAERVIPARPFARTGIDFCGPIKVHFRIRGKGPVKAYIAVFICFTTRAVHLELVGDLSTDAFIAALKRFIGRRGLCATIFCDNATNFMGARSSLNELYEMFQSEQHKKNLQEFCMNDKITWKPIPPKSPHFGGLWEAAVKSAKYHLVRVVANASLTFEEMSTVIVQIEAVLNSRPLTQLSSDPNDLEALTPGHFLIGAPLTAIPEPDTNPNILINSRYKHIRQLHQHFWSRWSMEYLNQLQQRVKWTTDETNNIELGSLVLIKEDNLPPLKWALGRVTKLYTGSDGIVRVVDVKTQHGVYKRSTRKLCPLPTN